MASGQPLDIVGRDARETGEEFGTSWGTPKPDLAWPYYLETPHHAYSGSFRRVPPRTALSSGASSQRFRRRSYLHRETARLVGNDSTAGSSTWKSPDAKLQKEDLEVEEISPQEYRRSRRGFRDFTVSSPPHRSRNPNPGGFGREIGFSPDRASSRRQSGTPPRQRAQSRYPSASHARRTIFKTPRERDRTPEGTRPPRTPYKQRDLSPYRPHSLHNGASAPLQPTPTRTIARVPQLVPQATIIQSQQLRRRVQSTSHCSHAGPTIDQGKKRQRSVETASSTRHDEWLNSQAKNTNKRQRREATTENDLSPKTTMDTRLKILQRLNDAHGWKPRVWGTPGRLISDIKPENNKPLTEETARTLQDGNFYCMKCSRKKRNKFLEAFNVYKGYNHNCDNCEEYIHWDKWNKDARKVSMPDCVLGKQVLQEQKDRRIHKANSSKVDKQVEKLTQKRAMSINVQPKEPPTQKRAMSTNFQPKETPMQNQAMSTNVQPKAKPTPERAVVINVERETKSPTNAQHSLRIPTEMLPPSIVKHKPSGIDLLASMPYPDPATGLAPRWSLFDSLPAELRPSVPGSSNPLPKNTPAKPSNRKNRETQIWTFTLPKFPSTSSLNLIPSCFRAPSTSTSASASELKDSNHPTMPAHPFLDDDERDEALGKNEVVRIVQLSPSRSGSVEVTFAAEAASTPSHDTSFKSLAAARGAAFRQAAATTSVSQLDHALTTPEYSESEESEEDPDDDLFVKQVQPFTLPVQRSDSIRRLSESQQKNESLTARDRNNSFNSEQQTDFCVQSDGLIPPEDDASHSIRASSDIDNLNNVEMGQDDNDAELEKALLDAMVIEEEALQPDVSGETKMLPAVFEIDDLSDGQEDNDSDLEAALFDAMDIEQEATQQEVTLPLTSNETESLSAQPDLEQRVRSLYTVKSQVTDSDGIHGEIQIATQCNTLEFAHDSAHTLIEAARHKISIRSITEEIVETTGLLTATIIYRSASQGSVRVWVEMHPVRVSLLTDNQIANPEPRIPVRIFHVICSTAHHAEDEDGSLRLIYYHEPEIVGQYSNINMANTAAFNHFSTITKPKSAKIDWVQFQAEWMKKYFVDMETCNEEKTEVAYMIEKTEHEWCWLEGDRVEVKVRGMDVRGPLN